jgi:hypothetical protein
MIDRYTTHKKRRRARNKSIKKYMVGGKFTEEDNQYLKANDFDDEEIQLLNSLEVSKNIITNKINYIENSHQDYDNTKIKLQVMAEIISDYVVKTDLNQGTDTSNMAGDDMAVSDMKVGVAVSDKGGNRKRKYYKKNKKTQKKRKHKQKGGKCYGHGVGSNSYDPNYSIYNTNMLKLFPYKS